MDAARYVLGVLVLMALPPGLLLWVAIHPLARYWRRVGVYWTYAVLSPPVLALMSIVYAYRRPLLGTDLGTHALLVVLSVCVLAVALRLALERKKQLTSRILMGVPELSRADAPGILLTEGIYARMRHPRYVEIVLWSLAYALFSNFVGVYVLWLLSLPTILLVVWLEERELRDRFGARWDDYCQRVPRFVPRRRTS